ncbi:MAG: phosphoglycerate dehydrogenase [Ignavibacteriaceae bacterium]|nr:phosphoglycerate dehydrogenase [Ignavibacteriaceae bacterium]
MKILVSPSSFGQCGEEPLEILKRNGYEIINNPYGRKLTEDEVIEHASDVVGIVAGVEPLNKKVMDNLPNLKCISRVGVGMDSVDIDYAKQKGIKVVNTPDGPTRPVAELTIALTMDLLRRVSKADKNIKNKIWKKEIGNLILNKKIGIFGFGRIGKTTAILFQGLGAKIIAFDLYPDNEYAAMHNIKMVSKEELFSTADIVTIHVPGNKDKAPVISYSELDLMKNTSYLINISRGGVVDEDAFYNILKNNKIVSAATDVFVNEPYSGKLIELENILLTPHLGSYAEEAKLKMEIDAVNNLINSLDADNQ